MSFDLGDYQDVKTRHAEFKAKHPAGCLRPADLEHPYRIATIGNATFVVVVAAAYRAPDDPTPGIGMAWEPVPGKTSYTRDSELQNAETSAWGRAIAAALAIDLEGGVASREEVRNRQRDADVETPKPRRKQKTAPEPVAQELPPGVDPDVIGEVIDTIEALTDDQKEAFHAWKAAQGFPWPWPSEACSAMMLEIARILSAEVQPA